MWSYSSIILCSFEFKHIRSRFVKLKWLFWSRGKFHRFKWKWITDNVTTKICHITAEMTLQWKYFTRFRVNHDAFYVNLNQYCFIIKDVFQVIHERKIHTKPSKWNVVRLCCTFLKVIIYYFVSLIIKGSLFANFLLSYAISKAAREWANNANDSDPFKTKVAQKKFIIKIIMQEILAKFKRKSRTSVKWSAFYVLQNPLKLSFKDHFSCTQ